MPYAVRISGQEEDDTNLASYGRCLHWDISATASYQHDMQCAYFEVASDLEVYKNDNPAGETVRVGDVGKFVHKTSSPS